MTERSRWTPVIAYAAVSAANQMLWLTYTPITTDASHHYGVSEGAIGWLAEIFPLLYVLLALPAGRVIDRHLGSGLAAGGLLTALGAVIRLDDHSYLAALGGQILVAIAQPLILNAVTKLSGSYLRAADRPTGIAVSSAGIFGGMVLALVLGAAIGGHHLEALLLTQAIFAVVVALALCVALRERAHEALIVSVPLRTVWSDGYLRVLIGLVCVGFGVFVALTTWLQALLDPAGVSSSAAGVLLLIMVVAGVIGSALLPPVIARNHRELTFLVVSIIGGVCGCLVLAAAPGLASGIPVLFVLGVLLLTDLPIVLELAERRAGPAGGTATALIWMAGNAAGLVAALIVQALVHRPAIAFTVLALLLLPGFVLARALATQARTVTVAPTVTQL